MAELDASTELLIRKVADDAARRAVASTLTTLGVDHTNPLETQRDFAALRNLRELIGEDEFRRDLAYLRSLRQGLDAVKSRGVLTVVGLLVVGFCAALWAGIKAQF